MSVYSEKLDHIHKNYGLLTEKSGEPGKDFLSMHVSALKDGALSHKEKELMCLCVAISIRCEGCILDHLSNAIDAGATKDEITETVNTALVMSGGPAYVYGGTALEAMEELFDKKRVENK
ncbi:carboxymuconolactone decarboxylase family protein [Companilactobacillus jidongensis]|uniref:carboxymuconolactone decarboxylase family protein n=1 Tax=Companilactobacillus jidongensis TaxID=2486006 RepID=UPI000F7A78B5|nr:carboxymuconolactone decarboxylase family protein [Companilactobacillus jidongensis]